MEEFIKLYLETPILNNEYNFDGTVLPQFKVRKMVKNYYIGLKDELIREKIREKFFVDDSNLKPELFELRKQIHVFLNEEVLNRNYIGQTGDIMYEFPDFKIRKSAILIYAREYGSIEEIKLINDKIKLILEDTKTKNLKKSIYTKEELEFLSKIKKTRKNFNELCIDGGYEFNLINSAGEKLKNDNINIYYKLYSITSYGVDYYFPSKLRKFLEIMEGNYNDLIAYYDIFKMPPKELYKILSKSNKNLMNNKISQFLIKYRDDKIYSIDAINNFKINGISLRVKNEIVVIEGMEIANLLEENNISILSDMLLKHLLINYYKSKSNRK